MAQPYKIFEERRKYPRVVIATPVTVLQQEKRITGMIHDVSADGIQVRCNRRSFQLIHPSGRYIRKENAPVVDTVFALNINNQLREIKVRGLVYYFVVLPNAGENDIAFGMHFISMDDRTVADINSFIEAAMVPDEEASMEIMKQPESVSDLANTEHMNSYEVKTSLLDLLNRHGMPVPESAEDDHNQCVATCIETLFEKISEVEHRIYRLEEKITD